MVRWDIIRYSINESLAYSETLIVWPFRQKNDGLLFHLDICQTVSSIEGECLTSSDSVI